MYVNLFQEAIFNVESQFEKNDGENDRQFYTDRALCQRRQQSEENSENNKTQM